MIILHALIFSELIDMSTCVKVINKRVFIKIDNLFHYAHFICDCLFPEIIEEIYLYNIVYRQKTIKQTIGIFSKIYEDVMKNKNIEERVDNFSNINCKNIILGIRNKYIKKIRYVNKFRRFIFERYNIYPLLYDINYPEVLLIKRNTRINLIDDPDLSMINKNITTGCERREIKNIDKLEEQIRTKYTDKFQSTYLEDKPFEEQVKLFNNAKIIILAHGAAMANIFFCKKGTMIIEVTCNTKWPFFDNISSILKLNHIKVNDNNIKAIINTLPAQ